MNVAYFDWLKSTAFEVGTDLPSDYQARVFEEGVRVARNILGPHGLERRKVLLIGGAGYIGTPLTQYLLARGYHVRTLDLLLYQNERCVMPFLGVPGYEFMRGDLADQEVIEKALEGISDVVILAGLVGDPITKSYPEESCAINERGMLALLRTLKGHGLNKVVFISTCSNYGEIPAGTVADEDYELKPLSLYAKAKVAMEQELLGLRGNVDYCASVTRFATAFGLSARTRFDLTVNEFTRDMAAGNDLEVYDADTWRPYCHVQDFARGITRILEAPRGIVEFEVFNMGGDRNNYTKQMIVDAVQQHLPAARYTIVKGGMDRRNYKVSFQRVRDRLHFEPLVNVDQGIGELIAAYRSGLFKDSASNRNFYGNYEIHYPAQD